MGREENRIDTVNPGQQSTVIPDAPPGILFPGDQGVSKGLAPADLNNFAPRIGLAWDVFGNGKTSVRAGYGLTTKVSMPTPWHRRTRRTQASPRRTTATLRIRSVPPDKPLHRLY